jgi:voltage-gated sodium channel
MKKLKITRHVTGTINDADGDVLDGHMFPLCAKLVRGPKFEYFFCGLIAANSVMLALETQYRGIQIANELQYPGYSKSKEDAWPWAEMVFNIVEWFFGICFAIEISMRMVAYGRKFHLYAWHWFDLTIVLIWVLGAFFHRVLPINASMMRMGRMARLLRMVRLARTVEHLDSLFLLTTAIRGSLRILAWSVALLIVVQMFFALVACQFLREYYLLDVSRPIKERTEIYVYFGSFTRALFSMCELTLANYPVISRKLAENVHESCMFMALLIKLTMGFAVIGVINGVFMQETMKAAAEDDRVNIIRKQKASLLYAEKMQQLFEEADISGDGLVSRGEFNEILARNEVRIWLSAMDFDIMDQEADIVFALLDTDKDGSVSIGELIAGMTKLKGAARKVDLRNIQTEVTSLASRLDGIGQAVHALRSLQKEVTALAARSDGIGRAERSGVINRSDLVVM